MSASHESIYFAVLDLRFVEGAMQKRTGSGSGCEAALTVRAANAAHPMVNNISPKGVAIGIAFLVVIFFLISRGPKKTGERFYLFVQHCFYVILNYQTNIWPE
jgi:hypothetical protein